MQGFEISVTLKGKSVAELIAQAQGFIDADTTTAVDTAAPAKRGRKAKEPEATVEETEELMADASDEEQLAFDMEDESKPTPKAKAKALKLTDKDINTAAMAHARATSRKETLSILSKQFKVKSILELKPEQYDAVMKALAV